jgi:hypothetical protein
MLARTLSDKHLSSPTRMPQPVTPASYRPQRHRLFVSLLALPIWAASMFIHLFDFRLREEVVHVHVHSLYLWFPAVLREPDRFFTDSIWMLALGFTVINLLHFAVCYGLSALLLRLIYRCTHVHGS